MDNLLRDIKAAEGCRLTAYKDSRGYWTIGYGHLLSVDPNRSFEGVVCTQDAADLWLEQDIEGAKKAAMNLPEWRSMDTEARQNALIELVFNMGVYKWRQFRKTRAAIQMQNWPVASAELLDSDWADQVGWARSRRLATRIGSGMYPV